MNATDELTVLRTLAETDPGGAAKRMTLGLMRGNAEEHKLGYSAENAAMAAADFLSVPLSLVKTALEVRMESAPLAEFLAWLHENYGYQAQSLIDVVDEPHNWWMEHADFLVSKDEDANPACTTQPAVA